MNKNLTVVAIAAALLMLAANAQAANIIKSTFDNNNENWKVVDINQVTGQGATPVINAIYNTDWSPSYIHATDSNLVDAYFFSAPSKFLGNQSAMYGGNISWDEFNYTTGAPETGLILTGGGHTLYRDNMYLAVGAATHFDFSLTPSSDWHLDSPTGAVATSSDMLAILSSLNGMYILGDWVDGYDTADLDNVLDTPAVPEPATMSLLGLGALLLLRRRSTKLSLS